MASHSRVFVPVHAHVCAVGEREGEGETLCGTNGATISRKTPVSRLSFF